MSIELTTLDRKLIGAMRAKPRATVSDLARLTSSARGTVYTRLDRLEKAGVIVGFGPDVDPAAAGLDVVAFVSLEIVQGSHAETTAALASIETVLDIHTVTGDGDLLVRLIAETNTHLHDLVQQITAIPTVRRSRTQLALKSASPRTVADVIAAAS